jgi:ATP-dependent RNA helicase DDX24/MAK5
MVPNREIGIVTVVGGMAIQKQKRLLSYAPEIVIGTPGRLWDLIENTHPHLESISRKLRFLVVDEADRMLQNGSYPEMEKIFNKLRENTQKKTKSKATSTDLVDLSESEEEENDDNQNDSALFGEIKAPTFQDILKIQQQMKDQNLQKEKQEIETHKEKDLFCPPCVRQTFLFSATLTIPESGRFQKGTKKKMQNALSVLENVMARVGLRGKPAVVDLSATDDESKQNNKKKKNQKEKEDQDPKITAAIAKEDLKKQNIRKNTTVSLPQGLELCQYEVTDSTRDNYLYYFLTQYPGHTIIFLNAIQQVRKVSNLLALLKLPAFALHAEMQQRQRLKKLDAFRAHKNGILVATDVAARGLDIPSVQYVVHYHIARSTEVFIHRSGRTARAQQDGLSLSFVSPSDAKYHAQICKLLERPTGFSEFPFDHRFLPPIEERVKLAKDIASEENSTGKIKSEENWFAQMAEAADLELDDELMKEFQNKKQFKKNNGKHKKESVTSQRMTLDRLLSQSLRPVGSSRKFRHIHQELGTTISTDGEYKKRDAADDLEKKSKKSFKRFRRR